MYEFKTDEEVEFECGEFYDMVVIESLNSR